MASIFAGLKKAVTAAAKPVAPLVLPASPFGGSAIKTGPAPAPAPPPAAPVSVASNALTTSGGSPFVNNYQRNPAGPAPTPAPAPAPAQNFFTNNSLRGDVGFNPNVAPISQPLPFTGAAAQPGTPQPAAQPAPAPTPRPGSGYGAALATIPGSFNQGGETGGIGTTGGSSGMSGGNRPSGEAQAPVPERSAQPMPTAGPAPTYRVPSSAGVINNIYSATDNLRGPGVYEQWFQNNQNAFRAPSALDDYWNGVRGTLTGQRFQPTYAADAYGGYRDYMNAPSQGVQNAYQISNQLRNRGTGENMMAQAGDMFRGNNSFQNYANQQLNSGWFNAPGNTQNVYNQNQNVLGQAGAGYNAAMGVLGGMNYGQQAVNNIAQTGGGAQNVQNLYNQQFPGFLGRNTSGGEYGHFAQGLRDPSYSESLYESGNQGLNTYYDRAREKGMREIEDRMAAAGVFGSGDTATAMYELEGELGASQARDMASLASQADAARIARTGEARGWAGQIGDEDVARMGLGVEAAGLADQNRLALMGRQMEGYRLASDEASARAGRYLEADEGERARVGLAGEMAASADQETRLRRQLGLDTARYVGDANDRNARGFFDSGREMSSAEDRRMRSSLDAGLQADEEARIRRENAWGAARDMEEEERSWFDRQNTAVQTEAGIAQNVASQAQQRLREQGFAADRAQQTQENRIRNRLTDISDAVRTQFDAVRAGLSGQEQADLDLAISEIQDRINSGALTRAQGQQEIENTLRLIETGVRVSELRNRR